MIYSDFKREVRDWVNANGWEERLPVRFCRKLWELYSPSFAIYTVDYFMWSNGAQEVLKSWVAEYATVELVPMDVTSYTDATPFTQQYYEIPCRLGTCETITMSAPCTQCVKEEGSNPMLKYAQAVPAAVNYTAPTAIATITAQSDEAKQRDFLIDELDSIDSSYRYGKRQTELRKLFNLDANNMPKTSRELIKAITDGKFKLDERIAALQDNGNDYDAATDDDISDVWAAIEFDGPTPDKDGYDKAIETVQALSKDTRRTIIVKSPAEGLEAIKALEAWKPTGAAN